MTMKVKPLPTLLSVLRILLIPIFVWMYFAGDPAYNHMVAAAMLAVSGLTDLLDGYIARHFDAVTELGKLLDPVADKLTQVTVCLSLALKTPNLRFFLWVFLAKELCMIAGGLWLLKRGNPPVASKWFGKVATAVFYLATVVIVAVPHMPVDKMVAIMAVVAAFVVFAFVMYVPVFIKVFRGGGNGAPGRSE